MAAPSIASTGTTFDSPPRSSHPRQHEVESGAMVRVRRGPEPTLIAVKDRLTDRYGTCAEAPNTEPGIGSPRPLLEDLGSVRRPRLAGGAARGGGGHEARVLAALEGPDVLVRAQDGGRVVGERGGGQQVLAEVLREDDVVA